MNTVQPTLLERMKQDNIQGAVEAHPEKPNVWAGVLTRQATAPLYLTITDWPGEQPPTLEDFLHITLHEVETFENADGFESWCMDIGADEDDEEMLAYARRTYDALEHTAELVEVFLGEKYRDYLFETAEG